ncbi:hypothetical protein BKD09_07455 [Bradyrhizobium japonicum]|uniref:Uncharacterized protein n=2 Tax=Bradyrhizobium japonicum TaxID=375 RepID=A0A1L3F4E3_BRAJP|nr:hypothetical protein BKD09_07455 [Bradyrhizobium japonicum]
MLDDGEPDDFEPGDGEQGKLIKFYDRLREFEGMVRAVTAACDEGQKMALKHSQDGLQPRKIWNIWVRATARVWTAHVGLPGVRHDGDPKGTDFATLIDILQSSLAVPYRQHTKGKDPLPIAITRALNEGPAAGDFT